MYKIMIAEDDPFIRRLFTKVLQKNGYEIIEATNGKEAVRLFDNLNEKPNLIIVDFKMPEVNGLEMTNEILERDPNTNIIMITGDPKVNRNMVADKGIRFKSKPVKIDEFLEELQHLIHI